MEFPAVVDVTLKMDEDGAITIETLSGSLVSDPLEKHRYPWVTIGCNSARGSKNTIHADDLGGAKAMAEHLIGLGHWQFGILTVTSSTLTTVLQRLAGYCLAIKGAELKFDDVPRDVVDFSIESGYQVADELLRCKPRPTAILYLNDRMVTGALERAHNSSLRVPHDLSIVGFDDIPNARFVNPPLTTIQQPAYELGEEIARRLFELIDARNGRGRTPSDLEFEPLVFPALLVIRESAASPYP